MFSRYCLFPLVAAACLLFVMALPVTAQQGQPGHYQSGDTQQQPQISDAELGKTAKAFVKIKKLNEQYQQQLQQTENQEQRQQLQQATNQKMMQAVENAGIDTGTYNSIMSQVQRNEALSKEFMEKVQEIEK